MIKGPWMLFGVVVLVAVVAAFGGLTAAELKLDDAIKLFEQEKFADAERALAAMSPKSRDAIKIRLLMGWTLWKQDRYDEALVAFKTVLQDAPAKVQISPQEFAALIGDTGGQIWSRDPVTIDNPDVLQARKGLGWAYFKKGWLRLAGEQFDVLHRVSAKWDEPYLGLGYVALARGDLARAETLFAEYVTRTATGTKKPHEGERGLGDVYSAKGDHARAVAHYDNALAAKPRWIEVQSSLAWSALKAGNLAKAASVFGQLKTSRPVEFEAGMAWVSLKQDRLDDAETGFGRALTALPGYEPALAGMRELRVARYKTFDDAWAQYYAGKYGEAAAAFEALMKDRGRMPSAMSPFIKNGLGWAELALGKVSEAEQRFTESLRELPSGAEATAGLGWVALRRKEWDKAEKALVEANAALPGLAVTTEGFAGLHTARFGAHDAAWGLYYQGKYAEAIAAFRALLDGPNDLPATSLALVRGAIGWSELARGQVEAAEAAFQQIAPGSKVDDAEAKTGAGWVALKRDQLDQAQKLFTEAVVAVPGYAAALRGFKELRGRQAPELDAAWVSYHQGAFVQAVSGFKAVVDNERLSAEYRMEARRALAWSLYFAGKLDEAADHFTALVATGEDADLLSGRGLTLAALGRHADAVSVLKRVTELLPYSADYHLAHGWALLRSGQAKEALQAFGKAYELAPASAEVNRSLGWAYVKSNRPAEAKAAFRYALTLIPGYADDKEFRNLVTTADYRELARDLAWGYIRWQAFEPARKLFEEMAKNDAADGDAWFGHGYALYKLGKAAAAEKSLQRSLKARRQAIARTVWVVFPELGGYPVLTDPRSILGWTALVSGKCEQALERFSESLQRDPDFVASLVGQAACLAKAGKASEARELYLTAAEVYPTYPPVVAGLRETEAPRKAALR